jgi:hypothetical protein
VRAPRTAFVGRSIDLAALTQAVAPTATVRAALEPLDLGDLAVFCRQACVSRELRPYQVEAGSAIVASVAAQRGDLLTVMMARQMGKNQLSAVVEYFLLHRYRSVGGPIVEAAPTFRPQLDNSKRRLEGLLAGPYSAGEWFASQGYILGLGRVRVLLFSADPGSNVVGATADLLLEVDEVARLCAHRLCAQGLIHAPARKPREQERRSLVPGSRGMHLRHGDTSRRGDLHRGDLAGTGVLTPARKDAQGIDGPCALDAPERRIRAAGDGHDRGDVGVAKGLQDRVGSELSSLHVQ